MLQTSSYSVPLALTVVLPRYCSSSRRSCRNFSRFSVYAFTVSPSGSVITSPLRPSTMTKSPFFRISVAFSTLSTAGISSARARMAEWEVFPPVSVMMPTILSLLIPAVTEGVSSLASRIVPAGASLTLTSFTPRRTARTPDLISRISAALCRIISSSTLANMLINISLTLSKAASAHCPSRIRRSASPVI